MGHQSQTNLDQDDDVKQNPEPSTIVEVWTWRDYTCLSILRKFD